MPEQYQRPPDATQYVCLDTAELDSYCRGHLAGLTIIRIEDHLYGCHDCRCRVAAYVRELVLQDRLRKPQNPPQGRDSV
jgi:hypothetical protein